MYGAFEVFDRSDIFVDLAPSNLTSHSHIRNQFAVGGVIRQVIIGTCTEFCNRKYHISANGWGPWPPLPTSMLVLYVFVKSVGARVCNSNGECLKGIPLIFCILTHHHFSHKPLKLQGAEITL